MLETIAWVSLGIAFACASLIAVDEISHPQKMGVMNIVWPVTALYGSVFALWAYFAVGRAKPKSERMPMEMGGGKKDQLKDDTPPTVKQTAVAASHCGSGCTLADIVAEFGVFALGLTIGNALFASFVWDFVLAWALGIVFQYFTIKPMRDLSVGEGIWAAIKADTFSILSFQVGMYAWMALVFYKFFPAPHLEPNKAAYWLMMQIAMIFGFLTACPMNYMLIRLGLKEKMG